MLTKLAQNLQSHTKIVIGLQDLWQSTLFIHSFIKLQDEIPTTQAIDDDTVPIKRMRVRDDTGEIQVTLWRNLSTTEAKKGDYVRVTNTAIGSYGDEKNVSSTHSSIIEVRT